MGLARSGLVGQEKRWLKGTMAVSLAAASYFPQGLARTLFRLTGAGSRSNTTEDAVQERAVAVKKGCEERGSQAGGKAVQGSHARSLQGRFRFAASEADHQPIKSPSALFLSLLALLHFISS